MMQPDDTGSLPERPAAGGKAPRANAPDRRSSDRLGAERPGQVAEAPLYNLSGQKLGEKGLRTRRRIIDALTQIDCTPAELSVRRVAAAAGVRSTTVYEYFADLSDIVLAALERVHAEMREIVAMLDEPWPAGSVAQRARALVGAHFDYVQRNTQLLNLRNSMSDAGDLKLTRARLHSAGPLMHGLTAKIAGGAGSIGPREDAAAALFIVTALERGATIAGQKSYRAFTPEVTEVDSTGRLDAAAHIIWLAMGGEALAARGASV